MFIDNLAKAPAFKSVILRKAKDPFLPLIEDRPQQMPSGMKGRIPPVIPLRNLA
jgi:hypothetical protein